MTGSSGNLCSGSRGFRRRKREISWLEGGVRTLGIKGKEKAKVRRAERLLLAANLTVQSGCFAGRHYWCGRCSRSLGRGPVAQPSLPSPDAWPAGQESCKVQKSFSEAPGSSSTWLPAIEWASTWGCKLVTRVVLVPGTSLSPTLRWSDCGVWLISPYEHHRSFLLAAMRLYLCAQ